MFPYKIWSIVQRKLPDTNPYYVSDNVLNWMNFAYYPIVNWTQEELYYGKVAQYFSATSYGYWWLPMSIVRQSFLSEDIKVWLTSQQPSTYLEHKNEYGWILFDIRQAGKYVSRN